METTGYLGDVVEILAVGLLVALVLGRARAAAIAGLVVAGVLIGPRGLALVSDTGHVDVLADIGVALLLFGIGLELTPSKIRGLRREALVAGTSQVLATVGVVWLAAWLGGLAPPQALFLGCVAALSSTAVVLTRLDQRQELGRPHGRLALGILVLQDVAVVPMALLIPLLGGVALEPAEAILPLLAKSAFVVLTVIVGRRVAPLVLRPVARSPERGLFVLATLLICFGTAWLASLAGVSLAVGAFLGGVVVASTPFRHQSLAQTLPLRDVLTSFFFVSIGMLLDPRELAANPLPVAGLTLAITGGKALLTFCVASLGGWRPRVALAAALGLAQVGEFSFVLVHAAGGTELLPPELAQPLFAAIALSLLITPTLVDAAPTVAGWFGRTRLARRLDRSTDRAEADVVPEPRRHVVVAGFGLAGRRVLDELVRKGIPAAVIDLNPTNVEEARLAGCDAVYGDAADPFVLRRAGVAEASAVVIAIDDLRATERAVRSVRSIAPDTRILARAAYSVTVERLVAAGADDVVDLEEAGARALAERARALDPPPVR